MALTLQCRKTSNGGIDNRKGSTLPCEGIHASFACFQDEWHDFRHTLTLIFFRCNSSAFWHSMAFLTVHVPDMIQGIRALTSGSRSWSPSTSVRPCSWNQWRKAPMRCPRNCRWDLQYCVLQLSDRHPLSIEFCGLAIFGLNWLAYA